MKIIIADDEQPLLNFLRRGLTAEGLDVVSEPEIINLVATIKKEQPKVAILDRMFGEDDSVSLLSAIKSLPNPPMVLLLTAMDDVADRVDGLRQGADDYLCKPFDFDELLARVYALARRAENTPLIESRVLECGPLKMDLDERTAALHLEQPVELSLTRIEFDLLLYLAENKNKLLSRERILNRVWQSMRDPQTNIVDVYISRLRQKVSPAEELTIETVRGNGYRLIENIR